MDYIPATCHPDRYDAGDGLCHTCRRGRFWPAKCHPERKRVALGLCASCYHAHPIPRAVVRAQLAAQGGRCAYCKRRLEEREATADHRIPRRHGGTDDPSNIAAACLSCNSRKSASLYWRYRREHQATSPRSSADPH